MGVVFGLWSQVLDAVRFTVLPNSGGAIGSGRIVLYAAVWVPSYLCAAINATS